MYYIEPVTCAGKGNNRLASLLQLSMVTICLYNCVGCILTNLLEDINMWYCYQYAYKQLHIYLRVKVGLTC